MLNFDIEPEVLLPHAGLNGKKAACVPVHWSQCGSIWGFPPCPPLSSSFFVLQGTSCVRTPICAASRRAANPTALRTAIAAAAVAAIFSRVCAEGHCDAAGYRVMGQSPASDRISEAVPC